MTERTKKIKISEYAELMRVTRQTVLHWYHKGEIPFPTYRPGKRTILIEVPESFTGVEDFKDKTRGKTVAYCRVSTKKQKDSLPLQKLAIYEYANKNNINIDDTVEEIGSGFNENRAKLGKLLSDSSIGTIIVEHRERLARSNFNLIKKTLQAQGRNIIVVDDKEMSDDLVTEITEFMISACGRLYGRRGAVRVQQVLQQEGEKHEEE